MFSLDILAFQSLVMEALDSLPSVQAKSISNVAILFEEEPTPEQRQRLALRNDQTLFGLYEGVPLPSRLGQTRVLPDKITVFKGPLERASASEVELKENIRHTLWHEIGHYYGLDHDKIASLET